MTDSSSREVQIRHSNSRSFVSVGFSLIVSRSTAYLTLVYDQNRLLGRSETSAKEIVWNYNGPRWRGRPEVKQIRESDIDWRKWLRTRPYRAFDPRLYFEFRLYRDPGRCLLVVLAFQGRNKLALNGSKKRRRVYTS